MTKTSKAAVTSISAQQDQIVIRGHCDPEAVLRVYEVAPYEFRPDPVTRSPVAEVAEDVGAEGFTLTLDRFAEGRDRLYRGFRVGVASETGAPVEFLDGVRYVNELSTIAAYDYPYPASETIKGLQIRMVDDGVALGVGHAALNLNLPTIARAAPSDQTITYVSDGREYYFDEPYLRRFDQRVKELSDHGIVVTLILLNSIRWDNIEIDPELRHVLLHPDYDTEGRISAFNVLTKQGLAHYRAFCEFVAERYTRPDETYGRACGYIIGNEVDAQWIWCNAGEKTVEQYVREYATAVRTMFYAARKHYAHARVYLSLTHHWAMRHQDNPLRFYPGRDVIEEFNRLCQKEGDFDWSLAYHPYPQDLFHADFWNDDTAIDSFDTPRITFRNLDILTRYMSQPHLTYGGRLRHIILSEQGFHSDETEESEELQAAAYAFAYWKVEQNPDIESFILHAHVDNRDEFDLNLGLWRRDKSSPLGNAPGSPKPIYAVFRDIDGPKHDEIIAWAKGVVGEENWR
ncbi:MAG: DUF5722 domain-containing protein [Anaerolineae bacterium]